MSSVPTTLLWGLPGGYEWLLILIIVLIFFGNRIPGIARSLGSGINEFRTGLKEGQSGSDDKEPKQVEDDKSS